MSEGLEQIERRAAAALREVDELARDAKATRREAGQVMLHIAVVGMIGSLGTSGLAFWLLTGHWWAALEGVAVAATVDYGLLRWIKISARLRKTGAEPASGKVLDRVVILMTLYLNGSAGIAPLIAPGTPLAYAMLTFAHLFIPIVMMMVFIAAPNAELLLQAKERGARDRADAARQAVADVEARRMADRERERHTTERAVAARADAEARARQAVADAQRAEHDRASAEAGAAQAAAEAERADAEAQAAAAAAAESESRRAFSESERARTDGESARSAHLIASVIAFCAVLAIRLDNARAIETKANRRAVDRLRRQPVDSSPTAPVDSSSTARRQPSTGAVDSPRRQVVDSPGPAETVTLEELLTVARADLSTARKLGRPKLRRWLSKAVDGRPVSDHRAQQVQDAIRERNVLEFHPRTAGGER
ncbi:MAG: hypothetical protein ACRDTZ_07620 [Pseudonocardiaceae bacterium]